MGGEPRAIAGLLVSEDTIRGLGLKIALLPEGTTTVGRGPGCDVILENCSDTLSRCHAAFVFQDGQIAIEDRHSSNGTVVDGAALRPGSRRSLGHAATVCFGEERFRFLALDSNRSQGLPEAVIRHFSDINSLDISRVIGGALAVFRMVAHVEESYLISTTRHWHWGDEFLHEGATSVAMIDANPALRVSRTSIEECLDNDRKVVRFLRESADAGVDSSIYALRLRRIWIRPLHGLDGTVVAAVYLQSRGTGDPFTSATEVLLDAVASHLEVSIHNSALHKKVIEANAHLEEKVNERTRELADSHQRLIAQDRLATLGRLVAGIAHELNNPAGAIASLAETQVRLLSRVSKIRDRAANDEGGQQAHHFLNHVAEAAVRVAPDSRTRRQNELQYTAALRAAGVSAADRWARLLARMGGPEILEGVDMQAIAAQGNGLYEDAEDLYTFIRAGGTIAGAAANIARIVSGLKQYAHLDQAEYMSQDIHKGLELTLEILRPGIGAHVTVTTRFAPLVPVLHRPGELAQVWTNLVDNALRAMGESGELTIETRDLGDAIEVSVGDTGCGIPPEIQPRIFDLDFTTRGPGAGLGLGLPICRNIVEVGHGGVIRFRSQPGCTVFTVRLPKRDADP